MIDFFRREAKKIDLLRGKVEGKKEVLDAFEKLGGTKEWKVIESFVLDIKAGEGELALFSDESFEEVKDRRKYIQGWIDLMKMPYIVAEIREKEKKKKESVKEQLRQKLQRKYNPGG